MTHVRPLTPTEIEAAVALRQHDLLDRMVTAVEKVRDRMRRASRCLEEAGIVHAIVGGNAVAAWVSTVDPSAARNTRDVDLLAKREDVARITAAMTVAGFVPARVLGEDVFLDGPDALPSEAVHVVWAGEKVRAHYTEAAPDAAWNRVVNDVRMIELEPLVRMKLTSFRDKDRTHVRDLIGVGLVTADWLPRLSPALAERLSELLATPDG